MSVESIVESFKGLRADQILTSLAFDLGTSRDVDTEKRLAAYVELASQVDLSESDEQRLEQVGRELELRAPTPMERREAQLAYEMIQAAVRERMRQLPIEEQEKLVREIKVQLQEALTGSRRPT